MKNRKETNNTTQHLNADTHTHIHWFRSKMIEMRKERLLKQNSMRTRHMWVPARATNYHPSKHSSLAMSRALIFSSTQHPHPKLRLPWTNNIQPSIEYAFSRWHCFIDALQCLGYGFFFALWKKADVFSLSLSFVIFFRSCFSDCH